MTRWHHGVATGETRRAGVSPWVAERGVPVTSTGAPVDLGPGDRVTKGSTARKEIGPTMRIDRRSEVL